MRIFGKLVAQIEPEEEYRSKVFGNQICSRVAGSDIVLGQIVECIPATKEYEVGARGDGEIGGEWLPGAAIKVFLIFGVVAVDGAGMLHSAGGCPRNCPSGDK